MALDLRHATVSLQSDLLALGLLVPPYSLLVVSKEQCEQVRACSLDTLKEAHDTPAHAKVRDRCQGDDRAKGRPGEVSRKFPSARFTLLLAGSTHRSIPPAPRTQQTRRSPARTSSSCTHAAMGAPSREGIQLLWQRYFPPSEQGKEQVYMRGHRGSKWGKNQVGQYMN